MREIWNEIEKWAGTGIPSALATVVKVQGSSLRQQGSKMAVSAAGEIAGSVTGGCVEGAVFEEAQAVMQSGLPRRLSYGVPDAAAWEVGLACGGSIEIFVEALASQPWQAVAPAVRACLEQSRLAALATVVAGPGLGHKCLLWAEDARIDPVGDLGQPALNQGLADSLPAHWTAADPMLISLPTPAGEAQVFVDFITPPPRLVIVGAVHIAIPLVALAKTLNFHTIVVDARAAFATRQRFPHADELIVAWPSEALAALKPDPSTCVVCLSHDEKLDNPALQAALASPAGYVGALGSRLTHAKRLQALRSEGVAEDRLQRIHAPIGLDLGARQPEEIALAILAEIMAERHASAHNRPAFYATHSRRPVSLTS